MIRTELKVGDYVKVMTDLMNYRDAVGAIGTVVELFDDKRGLIVKFAEGIVLPDDEFTYENNTRVFLRNEVKLIPHHSFNSLINLYYDSQDKV